MTDLAGITIGGRYHIVEPLGQGGMATVYKAYDTRLERYVAVKVIRTDAIPANQYAIMLRRFEREAKSVAKLDHPNIIKVHDYGVSERGVSERGVSDRGGYEGAPYLVMQYMPGGSLKEKTGKPLPYPEAARLLLPIAQALAYAHQQGVVHRDVKPANILISQHGTPMLSDFGIARMLEHAETTQLTGTGAGIGTPEYMPPEQWAGKPVPQSDIYALGVVLYELITGRKPYQADTPAALLMKLMTDPLPRPKQFLPDLPEAVENVLFKALAKQPEERFASMAEFTAALEALSMQKPAGTWARAGQDFAETVTRQAPGFDLSTDSRLRQAQPTASPRQTSDKPPDSATGRGAGRSWLWLAAGLVGLALLVVVITGVVMLLRVMDRTNDMRTQTAVAKAEVNNLQTQTAAALAIQTATQAASTQVQTLALTLTPAASLTQTPAPTLTLTLTHTWLPTSTEELQPTSIPTSEPSFTPVPEDPVLVLDAHYFCRDGPDPSYRDRWDFPAGTEFPVLGKSRNGWWLVKLDIPDKTRAKQCWIGGGTIVGDESSIPYAPEIYTSEYNNNPD